MTTGTQPNSFRRIFNSANNAHTEETMQSAMQQNYGKSGWLLKQGGVIKSWHKRWFVLRGDQLLYFTNTDESKQMGSIFLPGNKVVELQMNPNEPERYPFEIIPGKNMAIKLNQHTNGICTVYFKGTRLFNMLKFIIPK